ncbi:ABC transporter permease [Paracoccus sp. S-4012]|uniref:ABC transporter permease n=1 Tax=Paracoccus sp. S-4012 TaxID=2665648 RepID=UPI0012B0A483|nr:ABC transporter permease [Paracoccus sp. S-4012]MRX52075.1 ABC transporter permease [Paracoccus sp. S-4012]
MRDFTAHNRWIWPALGILLLWLALALLTERLSLASLSGVAATAGFLALPALGQMLVITSGGGNIDLSIPGVIALSAYLSVLVLQSGAGSGAALLAILAAGAVVGAVNAVLVLSLRIPAMIATLASGYILATGALLLNGRITAMRTGGLFQMLATARVFGVPSSFLIAAIAAAILGLVLARLAWGRKLLATGQSEGAARLAGVPVGATIALAFVLCSMLSAFAGGLIAGYAGGAFLEMGTPYLLQSVGAVVLGGTLIAGGSASAAGTLLGALLLIMIVTTMQIAGLPKGVQDILQGVIIILILSLAGSRARA